MKLHVTSKYNTKLIVHKIDGISNKNLKIQNLSEPSFCAAEAKVASLLQNANLT